MSLLPKDVLEYLQKAENIASRIKEHLKNRSSHSPYSHSDDTFYGAAATVAVMASTAWVTSSAVNWGTASVGFGNWEQDERIVAPDLIERAGKLFKGELE
jgi:hypothetical protein